LPSKVLASTGTEGREGTWAPAVAIKQTEKNKTPQCPNLFTSRIGNPALRSIFTPWYFERHLGFSPTGAAWIEYTAGSGSGLREVAGLFTKVNVLEADRAAQGGARV
jgi:hypothetical protein